MLNTLVHNLPVKKGSQWALSIPSVVYDPLRTHLRKQNESKELLENPSIHVIIFGSYSDLSSCKTIIGVSPSIMNPSNEYGTFKRSIILQAFS